ncbi:hypothetical protein GOB34_04235 [Sinorhizobium meliloti]|nr:hypothetical protein [Sinorhizobium meliloti]
MTKNQSKLVKVEELVVPDLGYLAKVYKDSVAKADLSMASVAEASAAKFATAEGALAEAVVLARFVDDASA